MAAFPSSSTTSFTRFGMRKIVTAIVIADRMIINVSSSALTWPSASYEIFIHFSECWKISPQASVSLENITNRIEWNGMVWYGMV